MAVSQWKVIIFLFVSQILLSCLEKFGIIEPKMLLGHKGGGFPFYVCMTFPYFVINRGWRIVVGTF